MKSARSSTLELFTNRLPIPTGVRRKAAQAFEPQPSVTFLMSDVVDFTPMIESLGDEGALRLMLRHYCIVREETRRTRGEEVELKGDSFLLAFGSPDQALLCAIRIQRALDEDRHAHPDASVSVRIGMHTGPAIRIGGRYFGKHLIVAARIAAMARGGETLVSGETYAGLERVWSRAFHGRRRVALKGLRGSYEIRRLNWA